MRSKIILLSACILGASLYASPGVTSEAHGGVDLVSNMSRLQYFTHKLGLAVSAGNKELQGYYVHEVEEVVEDLSEIRDFDGIPISDLVNTLLMPKLADVERSVKSGDAAAADGAYEAMLNACNRCHQTANRPYIRIERESQTPYLQSFAPRN